MAARRGAARRDMALRSADCRWARGTRGESRRFELSAWRRGGGEARRVEGSRRLSSARVMKWSSRSLLRVPLAGSRRALETGGERESPATGTRVRKRTARFLTSASALSRSPALHICSAPLHCRWYFIHVNLLLSSPPPPSPAAAAAAPAICRTRPVRHKSRSAPLLLSRLFCLLNTALYSISE